MAPKGREKARKTRLRGAPVWAAIYGGGLGVSRQSLVPGAVARYMFVNTNGPFNARDSRRDPPRAAALCLAADCRSCAVVADRLQRGQYTQPVRRERRRIPLPDHRAGIAPDPQHDA